MEKSQKPKGSFTYYVKRFLIPFGVSWDSSLQAFPSRGFSRAWAMAGYQPTADQSREVFPTGSNLWAEHRTSSGICRGNLHWCSHSDPNPELPSCEDCPARKRHAEPGSQHTRTDLFNRWKQDLSERCTLSLKASCCPADNQRSPGSLVRRSVRHSVVKSVPVISNSCSWVFSHSTDWTCSLSKPVQQQFRLHRSFTVLHPMNFDSSQMLITCLLGQETLEFATALEEDSQRRSVHFVTVVDGQTFQLSARCWNFFFFKFKNFFFFFINFFF